VSLLGASIDSDAYLAARQRTGIVPQGPGMYADLTTAEYLGLARDLYARGDLAATVQAFGLGEQLDKRMNQLSGGFQRRVVLAAALLADPELLLLDEPTVGLDPLASNEVHQILSRAMHTPGRTTLLCTHNLAEAEALCDDVVILRAGRVLVHAPLAQLRQRVHPSVRLRARQGQAALLQTLLAREVPASADAESDGVLVPLRDVRAEAPPLLRALLDAGLEVYACEPLEAGLESVFLDLVRS
jgi:ABC-type multidrug transport system ATPase subunit